MNIQFSDLFTEVKRISAYEAKGAVDGNGQSTFTETVVTDHEKPIIYAYFAPIAGEVRQTLNSAIKDIDIEPGESMEFIFHADFASLGTSDSFRRRVFDLIANYAMRNWLTEKKAGRAEFYTNLVADMLAQLPRFAAGLIYEGILPDTREDGNDGGFTSRGYACVRPYGGTADAPALLFDANPITLGAGAILKARNSVSGAAIKILDGTFTEIGENTYTNATSADKLIYIGVDYDDATASPAIKTGRIDILS